MEERWSNDRMTLNVLDRKPVCRELRPQALEFRVPLSLSLMHPLFLFIENCFALGTVPKCNVELNLQNDPALQTTRLYEFAVLCS